MPSTSSSGLTYFINLIIRCFLYTSLWRGYSFLEMVHFDLPKRRDLLVGTLLKFLCTTLVPIYVVAGENEGPVSRQHGARKWTRVRTRGVRRRGGERDGRGDKRGERKRGACISLCRARCFLIVWLLLTSQAFLFCLKSIYDFLCRVLFVHMHIKSLSLLMFR